MRRDTIKKSLFVIAGFAALPLAAQEHQSVELMLVENLSVQQRVVAHKKVVDYLVQNPEETKNVKVIAVDLEGKVYVLDENLAKLKCLGNPSCVSSSN